MFDDPIDWSKAHKDAEEIQRIIQQVNAERQMEQYIQYHEPKPRLRSGAEMVPIRDQSLDKSIPGIFWTLAQIPAGDLPLWPNHGLDQNPFESFASYGYATGLQFTEVKDPARRPWESKTLRAEMTFTLPHTNGWTPFKAIEDLVERYGRDIGKPHSKGGLLAYLLRRYGWFEERHSQVYFVAMLEEKITPSMAMYSRSKYSNHNYDEDNCFVLKEISMHIGPWCFKQSDVPLGGTAMEFLRRNQGVHDVVTITKDGTRKMEKILLYLAGREPMWEAHRASELSDLMGGMDWTENELRLASMLELNDEIFLDKMCDFPILSAIKRVTPEVTARMQDIYFLDRDERRKQIADIFGERTLKFTDYPVLKPLRRNK